MMKTQAGQSSLARMSDSRPQHGDQCPECDGTIVTRFGQFEHLKCRDCGYVPPAPERAESRERSGRYGENRDLSQSKAAMKMSLGEVRRIVRGIIVEAGYSTSAVGTGEHSFMVAGPDGRRYAADPTKVRRWLIQNTEMSGSERETVMSSGEVAAGVLSRMKRDKVLRTSLDKPAQREPKRPRRDPGDAATDRLGGQRKKAQRDYSRAVEKFARQWQDPEEHIDPEGGASDAALGFFWTYEKEWPTWSRLLDIRKSDMHANVTDYVYDAMTKKRS